MNYEVVVNLFSYLDKILYKDITENN